MIRKHKVAIINYPLMNPLLNIKEGISELDHDLPEHNDEAALYIHIPFCSRICKFCVYNRQAVKERDSLLQRYTDALVEEINMYARKRYIKDMKIGAVFVGGGTPTCLTDKQLKQVFDACESNLSLKKDVEITVECNILNCGRERLFSLKEMGVSRISAGIQTFDNKFRKMLGLPSDRQKALDWLTDAKETGFNVVAIDLMYGFPGQKSEEFLQDIETGLGLGADHFSLYELVVLAGSCLYYEIADHALPACPSGEELFQMYMLSDKLMKTSGYEHLIIPEYHKKEKRSAFWGLTYNGYGDNLSFGASSYGYLNGITYQNISAPEDYIQAITNGCLPVSMVSNRATRLKEMERTAVLSLRRGFIEKDKFIEHYGCRLEDVFPEVIDKLIMEGFMEEENDSYRLTTKGEYCQGDVSIQFMKSTFDSVSSLKKQISLGKHIVPETVS